MSIVLKAVRLQKLPVAVINALYQNSQNLPSLLTGVKENVLTERKCFLSD